MISRLTAAALLAASSCLAASPVDDARPAAGPSPIHFRPAWGNFADPIPFFWKGEYHVFYLRGDVPKVPWEHVVSTDLRSWKEMTTALTSDGKSDGPDGLHMFTGCVVEHQGVFHLYYTGWNPANLDGREFVMHATSPDLVKWTKHPDHRFAPDGRQYAKRQDSDFRDPFVFWNESEKRWWMLLCTRAAADNRPVTGVYTSADLKQWEPQAPLCDGYKGTPECPDLFRLGDLWYLIVSPSDNVTTYRTAKDLRGPWSPAPGRALDTPIFYAAKSQFDGRRHVLTGWLRDRENGRDDGGFRWGGTQSLPREVFAGEGGELLSRPVPEVRDAYPKLAFNLAAKPKLTTLTPEGAAADKPDPWRYEDGRLVAESTGLTRTRLDVPADYHLSVTVRLTGPATTFALAIRQQPARDSHYRLEVRPSKGEATLASFGSDYPRPVPFVAGRDIRIEAFVQGPLIECFIDGGHAFSGRAYQFREGKLDLLVTGGKAEIREFTITVPDPDPKPAK